MPCVTAAIYLKNEVQQYWQERETEPGAPAPFSIHEQDRTLLRDAIVDATAHAPEKLRYAILFVHISLCQVEAILLKLQFLASVWFCNCHGDSFSN